MNLDNEATRQMKAEVVDVMQTCTVGCPVAAQASVRAMEACSQATCEMQAEHHFLAGLARAAVVSCVIHGMNKESFMATVDFLYDEMVRELAEKEKPG